ncbi:MAG: aminotransferase class IV [Clostridia bacterium]|nr:aminotransferase class IV [Clostridia bacterium]
MDFAFYDGNMMPLSDIRIATDDRAFFFGDGVYDAMVGNGKSIFMEKEHLERFRNNLSALSLSLPYSDKEIHDILSVLMEKTGTGYLFLYVQASRAREERKHSSHGIYSAHFFAYAKRFALPDADEMLSLVSVEDMRYELCHIKTLNLLPNTIAATYAEQMGADEAVFVRNGIVRECSHSNISVLKDGTLITHPLDCHVLPGIMRKALIRCATEMGIAVEERCYTKEEVFCSDGVFITSTTRRCALACALDGVALPLPKEDALALHSMVNREFFEKMG